MHSPRTRALVITMSAAGIFLAVTLLWVVPLSFYLAGKLAAKQLQTACITPLQELTDKVESQLWVNGLICGVSSFFGAYAKGLGRAFLALDGNWRLPASFVGGVALGAFR
mmetsp:Transcript_19003/g.34322  ORF Transcript_19003/g.34322 Transcript_19003/m.34322 type:complete len:110 (-) Transcript_19003:8-337(-)